MRVGDKVTSLRINPSLLERVDKREKDIKERPMAIIKKSSLPVLGRGKAGTPSVTVAGKGQISFSPQASKVFGGKTMALIGWDAKTRVLSVQAFAKVPKDFTQEDMFTIGYAKKSNAAYFSASAILQDKDTGIGYDYKTSGNQSFPVTMDEKTSSASFKLPAGAMTPKPVTPRKSKTNGAVAPEVVKTASASANGGVLIEEVE